MNEHTEGPHSMPPHHLSVVVPVHREMENIDPLVERVHAALAHYPCPWELIIVDDGSGDVTAERINAAIGRYGSHVRLVQLQRNFGQTAAMQAGIDCARGEVIATMDGDLQNDPIDIPRMVSKLLNEDLDLVVGWRKARKDRALRSFLSRVANRLIGRVTGLHLHDYGCSLKVYRGDVIANVRLYGEMHRFIPAWVANATMPARIGEEVVTHHARNSGETKYGLSRTYRVLLDLLAVHFFMRYRARPGHFFGSLGLIGGSIGGAILFYLSGLKLITGADIGDRPLLLLGMMLVIAGIQLLTTGVLAEMATRTYYESSAVRPYIVRSSGSRNLGEDATWHVCAGASTVEDPAP
jgi:glycosyltransferase involved in cell wall biosynthesis